MDQAIERLRFRLREHPLYSTLSTAEDLRRFCERHVVCVLDFMSLLKSLQRDLTCTLSPWTPAEEDPEAGRLIQEIVVDEESDTRRDGKCQSHFAWYLEAMQEIGADTEPVRALVAELRRGIPLDEALEASDLPPESKAFGRVTAQHLTGSLAERAAVFLYGREEVIPELFLPLVERLESEGLRCTLLREYLERHVEVDGEEHGPRAERLLGRLFAAGGEDALPAAREALQARIALWDAIVAACAEDRDEVLV